MYDLVLAITGIRAVGVGTPLLEVGRIVASLLGRYLPDLIVCRRPESWDSARGSIPATSTGIGITRYDDGVNVAGSPKQVWQITVPASQPTTALPPHWIDLPS